MPLRPFAEHLPSRAEYFLLNRRRFRRSTYCPVESRSTVQLPAITDDRPRVHDVSRLSIHTGGAGAAIFRIPCVQFVARQDEEVVRFASAHTPAELSRAQRSGGLGPDGRLNAAVGGSRGLRAPPSTPECEDRSTAAQRHAPTPLFVFMIPSRVFRVDDRARATATEPWRWNR